MAQLDPQAQGTHFGRYVRPVWAAERLLLPRSLQGEDDQLTDLHITLRIIRMTARNCERRKLERKSVRNVVTEHDWLTKKVNKMLIKTDWLNMLVDRGGNEITSFHLNKYDFASAYLGTRYCCIFTLLPTRTIAVDKNGYYLRLA